MNELVLLFGEHLDGIGHLSNGLLVAPPHRLRFHLQRILSQLQIFPHLSDLQLSLTVNLNLETQREISGIHSALVYSCNTVA